MVKKNLIFRRRKKQGGTQFSTALHIYSTVHNNNNHDVLRQFLFVKGQKIQSIDSHLILVPGIEMIWSESSCNTKFDYCISKEICKPHFAVQFTSPTFLSTLFNMILLWQNESGCKFVMSGLFTCSVNKFHNPAAWCQRPLGAEIRAGQLYFWVRKSSVTRKQETT